MPSYNQLTPKQQVAIHDLCKLLHYDPVDGINLEEFTKIVHICNDSAGKGDRLTGKLYLRTLFDALNKDEERHAKSAPDEFIQNGNTLWGNLQNYSSLKSTVSADTWYSEELYDQINLRKPGGISFKEFYEIYNMYANNKP